MAEVGIASEPPIDYFSSDDDDGGIVSHRGYYNADIASEPQRPIDSSDDDGGIVSHRGYYFGDYSKPELLSGRASDSSYADGYSLLHMNQVAARSVTYTVADTDLKSETEESDKYRVIQAIRRFFSWIFPSKAALKTQTQTPQGKRCDSG